MPKLVLKRSKEKPLLHHHPWIFSGAIDRLDKSTVDGEIVDVVSARDEFLARGYVNRRSQIVVRLLTWEATEPIDEAFWARRLTRSISARPRTRT